MAVLLLLTHYPTAQEGLCCPGNFRTPIWHLAVLYLGKHHPPNCHSRGSRSVDLHSLELDLLNLVLPAVT